MVSVWTNAYMVNLANLLAFLGFSASYPSEPTPIGFSHYIFDNVDFNMATLDSSNTFHSMGGIKCIISAQVLLLHTEIKVWKYLCLLYGVQAVVQGVEVGRRGLLKLHAFENMNKNALSHFVVQDLDVQDRTFAPCLPSRYIIDVK